MAEILSTPLTVVHVVACVFLMLVVLIQPGKSGGMGAFTGVAAQQVFGGRGAGNILTKTTWVTATVFFFTSITLAYLSSSTDESLEKRATADVTRSVPLQKKAEAPAPPAMPTPEPAQPEPVVADEPTAPAEPAAPAAPAAPAPLQNQE
jgi:preprotein translocase subunit SecG